MNDLTFQYPSWYLLFCALLGIGYALLLYFRSAAFREKAGWIAPVLGVARALTVTVLAVLLLGPILRSLLTETQRPVVVLAQDVSESVVAELDSTARLNYLAQYRQLRDRLAERYDVRSYAFGETVRETDELTFADKATNTSDLLTQLYDGYSNQNLGAIILASDGIYNQGSNPVYAGTQLTAPIYTVALGDTVPRRDLILKRVFYNKIAYLGDRFSIQVDVAAQNAAGSSTSLRVRKVGASGAGQVLQSRNITIDRNDFFTTEELVLDADAPGVQRYRVSVTGIDGEETRVNNVQDIFVDVLDARQKILLLAHSPHPDLGALKQTIESNKNYEVTVGYADKLKRPITDYDFVVFHQLPAVGKDISGLLGQLNQRNTPRLFVVGSQSDLPALNRAQNLLTVQAQGGSTNDVQGTVAGDFNLFTLDPQLAQQLPQFSPVQVPFGKFTAGANAQPLLYQRIGKVDTEYPLLVVGEQDQTKVGVLAGENVWRWRLFDFLQHENHDLTDELLRKVVQYLTVKEDRRRFRVSVADNIFDENEAVLLDAELYNSNYELINDEDVTLTVTNEEGREFNFAFNRSGKAYQLDAGIFPVGNYRYTGRVVLNGETRTAKGQFSVQPVQLERYATTADHGLLRLLSERFDGALYYPDQLGALGDRLTENPIKPVLYQTATTREVIHLRWIFFLLLGLLSLEWFARRFYGEY